MNSVRGWVTLELRLGGVAGISQEDQAGKSISGRRNRYAKMTCVNEVFLVDGI